MQPTSKIVLASDDDLRLVYGGRSFWGSIKAAAKWAAKHGKATLHSIGIGGQF